MSLCEASLNVLRVRAPKGTARGELVPVVVSMSGLAPHVDVLVSTPEMAKLMVGSTVAVTRTASMKAILPLVSSKLMLSLE